MSPALFLLALQLYSPPGRGAERALAEPADSARGLARAHAAQVAFERSRRTLLPAGQSGGGHCDVRLGRFCWWYDGGMPHFPPENSTIGVRRAELLAELDSASQRHPGDAWLVGMRVHYRIDGRTSRAPTPPHSAAQRKSGGAPHCAAMRRTRMAITARPTRRSAWRSRQCHRTRRVPGEALRRCLATTATHTNTCRAMRALA